MILPPLLPWQLSNFDYMKIIAYFFRKKQLFLQKIFDFFNFSKYNNFF